MNRLNIPEILAPCGSYDILVAAIKAGADACYIGGNKFGARAYATNLDENSYKKAIEYAHLHNTRIYLTVNTLLKESEIYDLCDYLKPYYEAGLDAAIVQDLGVFSVLKDNFPDLKLHCSTQMNITSWQAAAYMKDLGATRIVTAREMSLDEIKKISDKVDIEIESFVHGAMCYSYSGQCLMSAYIGGRSGNRGRCAQPCRKCYDNNYILSMKDMCSLEIIPDIIDAGVSSLKIEGRMKNEYYVSSAVDAYKELATDYIDGSFSIEKAIRYKEKLANIFNRGGFCQGYYNTHNGSNMISLCRPNNMGVNIGKINQTKDGKVCISVSDKLYIGDVLELSDDIEITSNVNAEKGEMVWLNAPKTKFLKKGNEVLRTRCNHILDDVNDNIINNNKKYEIDGYLTATVGNEISFVVNRMIDDKTFTGASYGNVVELSKNSTVDKDLIASKLSQINDTDYIFNNLSIEVSDNAFVPLGVIKKLRRDAIADLEENILDFYRRNLNKEISYNNLKVSNNRIVKKSDIKYRVGITTISQLDILLDKDILLIDSIYVNDRLYRKIISSDRVKKLSDNNVNIIIELPYVCRSDFDIDKLYYDDKNISGIYVRNIGEYTTIINSKLFKRIEEGELIMIIGFSLYAYNTFATSFIGEYTYENSPELSFDELSALYCREGYKGEFVCYGYQQLMMSAQCVSKTIDSCKNNPDKLMYKTIEDEKKNKFYSRMVCDECINIIYNGLPFNVMDRLDVISSELNPSSFRIDLTIEDDEVASQIIDAYITYISSGKLIMPKGVYTVGRLFKGVE